MSSISIKKASIIFAASKYANLVINLILTIILARLLSPSDFGIIAILEVFAYLFILISEVGITSGIIQNKTLNKNDYDSIFSLTIYFGFILLLGFSLLSIPAAKFYNENLYTLLIPLLSISVFFNSINIVPNAVMLKNHEFKSIAIRNITVNMISGVISVILAYLGFRYYSLIAFNIINAVLIFTWNYNKNRLSFSFKISLYSFKKIFDYSLYQFLFSIVNYFSRNTDKILIGKFFSSEILGIYDRSYKTLLYPVGYLTNVITPVLHPILSNSQNDFDSIYLKYMKVTKFLSILGALITGFAFVASSEIIIILFGMNWLEVIPIFHVLSLSIWSQMIASSSGAIYQSAGNTKLLFLTSLFTFISTISLVIIGISSNNILTLTYLVLISYFINFFITFYMLVTKVLKHSFLIFLKNIISDYLIVLFVIFVFNFVEFEFTNIYLNFLFKGFLTLIVFAFGLLITNQYRLIISFMKEIRK